MNAFTTTLGRRDRDERDNLTEFSCCCCHCRCVSNCHERVSSLCEEVAASHGRIAVRAGRAVSVVKVVHLWRNSTRGKARTSRQH